MTTQPDFAKIRAAVLRMKTPGETPAALELIGANPVHIRPKSAHLKLPPEDAHRRKTCRRIYPGMQRPTFGSPRHFDH